MSGLHQGVVISSSSNVSSGSKAPSRVSGAPACAQAQGHAQSLKQQNAKLHDQAQQAQQQLEAAQRRIAELESQVWDPMGLGLRVEGFGSGSNPE